MAAWPIKFGAPPSRYALSWSRVLADGRGSEAEWRRYLRMAIGSVDEAKLWCRYADDLGYAQHDDATRWRQDFEEVARMLHGLIAREAQAGQSKSS